MLNPTKMINAIKLILSLDGSDRATDGAFKSPDTVKLAPKTREQLKDALKAGPELSAKDISALRQIARDHEGDERDTIVRVIGRTLDALSARQNARGSVFKQPDFDGDKFADEVMARIASEKEKA